MEPNVKVLDEPVCPTATAAAPADVASCQTASVTAQLAHLERVIRTIWKHRSSYPFREPVDPHRHKAPGYREVVKHPMDLGTIRQKLTDNEYGSAEDCVADFRLMVSNCRTYNPEGLPIRGLCNEIEAMFEKKVQEMQAHQMQSQQVSTTFLKRKASSPSRNSQKSFAGEAKELKKPPTKQKKVSPLSLSVRQPSRPDSPAQQQPVREITRPVKRPNKEWPEQQDKSAMLSPSLSYCMDALSELSSKKHEAYAFPFVKPVDVLGLKIPDYYDVISLPMDLGTIRKRLVSGRYQTPRQFVSDVRLVFTNCYRYNSCDTEVFAMAIKLQTAFEVFIAQAPKDLFGEFFYHSVADTETFETSSSSFSAVPSVGRNSRRQNNYENRQVAEALHTLEKKTQLVLDEVMKIRNEKVLSRSAAGRPMDSVAAKGLRKLPVHSSERINGNAVGNLTKTGCVSAFSLIEPDTAVEENNEDDEPMTLEEKRSLSHLIFRLPSHNLQEIVIIINKREPETKIIKPDKNEFEFDLEGLSPSTWRAIEKYVNGIKRKKIDPVQRKKFTPQEHKSKKEELFKKLKDMESQMSGKEPIVLPGQQAEQFVPKAGPQTTDMDRSRAARLSESGSSSDEEDDKGVMSFLNPVQRPATTILSHPPPPSSTVRKDLPMASVFTRNPSFTPVINTPASTHGPAADCSAVVVANTNNVKSSTEANITALGSAPGPTPVVRTQTQSQSCADPASRLVVVNAQPSSTQVPAVPLQESLQSNRQTSSGFGHPSLPISSGPFVLNKTSSGVAASPSQLPNFQSEVEKKKAEERKRRMALVGKIDMNAQSDLLNTFEEKF